jgi:hypothetical protein
MKTYSNNNDPIQFKIQDLDGKYKVITARSLDVDDMQKLTDMDLPVIDKYGNEIPAKPFVRMKEQMAFVFGGEAKDYVNYDIRIIKQVIMDLTAELRNPIVAQDQPQ